MNYLKPPTSKHLITDAIVGFAQAIMTNNTRSTIDTLASVNR